MRTFITVALILVLSACVTVPTREDSLVLDVQCNSGSRPVVEVAIESVGSSELAVGRAFGLDGMFFNLEIRQVGGGAIPVPKWEATRVPKSFCFRRNDKLTLTVPLTNFDAVFGNASCSSGNCLRVPLAPGDYEVRAIYTAVAPTSARCPRFAGNAVSEWRRFSVPAEALDRARVP